MLERERENIRKLVIGRIFWRVVVRVGGASFASIALMTDAASSGERADAASGRKRMRCSCQSRPLRRGS